MSQTNKAEVDGNSLPSTDRPNETDMDLQLQIYAEIELISSSCVFQLGLNNRSPRPSSPPLSGTFGRLPSSQLENSVNTVKV